MNITEVFQVLGIKETKDESLIKKAYRDKLAVTNPEDNPEGFKRLRSAYEEACNFARTESVEEENPEEIDDSPSGLWALQLEDIYKNMNKRVDVSCWETLFAQDTFLALEEEENCCIKLLQFLMSHYKLPTDVWKLLDEKMNITLDGNRFREYFPPDFMNYVIGRCRQGDDLDYHQFEGTEEADYDLFLNYSDQCWAALTEGNLEQAEEYIKNADDLEIWHPVMELNRACLWEKQGKAEEALEWLRKLRKRLDKDLMIDYHTAEMLWRNGLHKEAGEIYEIIKGNNEKHYMANKRLCELYYEEKRYKEAKKCAEEVLGLGGGDDVNELLLQINAELEKELEKSFREEPTCETGLELGWCYLQDGRYCKCIQHAKSIKGLITEEKDSEYKGLLTKVYVESAEYEEALKMAPIWEDALQKQLEKEQSEELADKRKKNEDRVRQSYSIRAYCYGKKGFKEKEYFQKSIECIEKVEELFEKDKPDFNILLEKSQIYLDMEEYEKGLEMAQELIEKYQIYAAFASMQRAYSRMWDAQGVVQSGYECIRYFPEYVKAYERIAKVYLDLKYVEDLQRLLEQAKENKIESAFLDAYEYQMNHERADSNTIDKRIEEFRDNYLQKLENGERKYYESGLPLINECLYSYPGPYLLVERALFHREAGNFEAAKADFESALSEEPGNPYAYNGLAYIYRLQKKYDKAMVYLKKAIMYYDEKYPRSYADLGDLYSLMGMHEMALEAYEQVLEIGGDDIRKSRYYMRRYAHVLARNGKVENAIKVLAEAYPDMLERFEEQAELYNRYGAREEAECVLDKWSRELQPYTENDLNQKVAKFYEGKAWAELIFGDGKKAIEYFEKQVYYKGETADNAGSYSDLIFACALCGNEEKGMIYSKKLRENMEGKKDRGIHPCHEMDKMALEREYMMNCFTASQEELEEILSREKDTNICYFCTECRCKELEGLRVLHMLRQGKKEEAVKYAEDILKLNPVDEYMRAVLNLCQKGVKVVPFSKELLKQSGQTKQQNDVNGPTGGLVGKLKKMFGKSTRSDKN